MKTTQQGFTLIELLVGMALLAVVLAIAGQFMTAVNKSSVQVVSLSTLENDLQLATLRLNEIVSQAAYIYPANTEMTLEGEDTIVTGKNAMAVLVAAGSPYCATSLSSNLSKYCLFIYQIAPRSSYASLLPNLKGVTDYVILEKKFSFLGFPQNTPPKSGNFTSREGILVDSVDADLTDFSLLRLSELKQTANIYDNTLKNGVGVGTNDPLALIQSVRPIIALKTGSSNIQRQIYIYARSVPRSAAGDVTSGN